MLLVDAACASRSHLTSVRVRAISHACAGDAVATQAELLEPWAAVAKGDVGVDPSLQAAVALGLECHFPAAVATAEAVAP